MKKYLAFILIFTAIISQSPAKQRETPGSIILDIFLDIFDELWIFTHVNAEYDTAPYANRKDYIIYTQNTAAASKFYRFQFENGFFYFPGYNTVGNETRIEGIAYKFFGPVIENIVLPDLTGNVRVGLTLNIINFNLLNLAFILEWTHWYGPKNLDGLCEGIIIRSYPVKPLIIEYRGNWQSIFNDGYSTNECIFESHLETGFMVGRHEEIYLAWKYFNNGYKNVTRHGISTGFKYHL